MIARGQRTVVRVRLSFTNQAGRICDQHFLVELSGDQTPADGAENFKLELARYGVQARVLGWAIDHVMTPARAAREARSLYRATA